MSNKQIIKNVFDNEFDSKNMKQQILLKYERKNEQHMNKFYKLAIPVCLVVIICGIFILNSNNSRLQPNDSNGDTNSSDIIHINHFDGIGLGKVDADIKEINDINIPYFDILSHKEIPNDFDGERLSAIYIKETKDSKDYNLLNNYSFSYYNTSNDRSIIIAFSNTHQPMRDYYLDESGKISKINNVELTIFQYENTYMTTFTYKNYHFDIETNDISQDEFITLLKSIIQ